MASTYVNNLRLNEMGTGDESGTWGTVTNTNLTLIADALGYQSKTVASASTDTLTIPDGTETDNEAISLYVKLTGGNQACTITVGPNTVKKLWIIENATSQVITLTQGSGANVILAAGVTKMIYADGAGSGAALTDALVGLEVGTTLYVKNAGTGDDSTAQLFLQTAEADIAANDVLGKINFQAPNEGTGTDAILVAAAIQAKSEGDFSSSSNATSLEFMTGASEAAATKMSLTSGGNVKVLTDSASLSFGADADITVTHVADVGLNIKNTNTGDDKPIILTLQTGETDLAANEVIGAIRWQAPDEGAGTDAILVSAAIQAVSEGDFSASSNATTLEFHTGASEAAAAKLKIDSTGEATFSAEATTNSAFDSFNSSAKIVNNYKGTTDGSAFTASSSNATVALEAGNNLGKVGTSSSDPFTIVSGSGDITVDAATDIVLDADGGNWRFKDDGTAILTISRDSNTSIGLFSAVSDMDMLFKGNDGGSTITALTLDMSDAGAASFNGKITADAGIDIDNINIDGTTMNLSSGDLTVSAAGDIILATSDRDIKFTQGGTHEANLHLGTGSTVLSTIVSDRDLAFGGNDGGSTITALTLDMSAAGAATFNNNVTAFSDRRLKSDIQTLENGLEKVEQLRGVTYTRDDNVDGGQQLGVIAQEVEEVFPQVVLTADDERGTKSVDYGRLTGALIEAVKELSAKVKELEGKLDALTK
jgi:hypothetical protein